MEEAKEIKNWIVAFDAGDDKDLCRHISAFTREEAEEAFANLPDITIEHVTNVEMYEDTIGAKLTYLVNSGHVEL